MAFSDARNERDRADTGRNSSNHGGGNARDAERRNREAMARNAAPSQYDSRVRNSRYNQNLIASGPLTPHNALEAMRSLPMSGFGAMSLLGGALGVPGLGPDYEGVTNRSATGFSYDGPDRLGLQWRQQQNQLQQGIQGIQAAGAPKPPAPQMPGMSPMQMPAGQLNVPGPSQYGVNLPSYGYFGQPPALQRPKSAIMGGI